MVTMLLIGVAATGVQVAAALPWLLAVDVGLRGVMLRALKGLRFMRPGSARGSASGCCWTSRAIWPGASLCVPVALAVDGRLLRRRVRADALVWPKGGAVALAAFRESVRQPMYWLLAGLGLMFLAASPIVPTSPSSAWKS